jgi:hypothetical protein
MLKKTEPPPHMSIITANPWWLVLILNTLSAKEAANLVARLAQTSRALYTIALDAIVQHVPWGRDAPEEIPATTLREFVRRVIFIFIKDHAHGHPTPRYSRDHRFDQARMWALQVVQPWAAHLKLPVPFVNEDAKESHPRVTQRFSLNKRTDERRMKRDRTAMAEALCFLARDVPLAYLRYSPGWFPRFAGEYINPALREDCWTIWHHEYSETPEEYALRVRADEPKVVSWLKRCSPSPGMSPKAHEAEVRRRTALAFKEREKDITRYTQRREKAYKRLPAQTAHHVKLHMQQSHRYTSKSPHFYSTRQNEILYAYATYNSTVVHTEKAECWAVGTIEFYDPLLVRIFKSLDSWERWEAMLAQLPDGTRFEFHFYHNLPGDTTRTMHFRPNVWAMFMPSPFDE